MALGPGRRHLSHVQRARPIHDAIDEFLGSGYVDEVVVVNNNATSGTDEEVRRTGPASSTSHGRIRPRHPAGVL